LSAFHELIHDGAGNLDLFLVGNRHQSTSKLCSAGSVRVQLRQSS
jgi:hypothetical protein